ncbi:MAG: L,D-transpeptidase [Deltaproteobacteria bacterium]|nr:L,D-transpeptidase [Deltaproteobacteria bacterium]
MLLDLATDPFLDYLPGESPVANGFVAPLDDFGACGEDCWFAEAGGTVRAPADGMLRVQGDHLAVDIDYFENHQRRSVTFWVDGATATRAEGPVRAGEAVATGVEITAGLLGTVEPLSAFVAARIDLPDPTEAPVLAVVSHAERELRIYNGGTEIGRYEVGFGQAEGPKERRGDNRTPVGLYYLVQKSTGPFEGDFAAYYGGHWMRINYPNAYDAARGLAEGLVDKATAEAIARAWRDRRTTPRDTRLGSGIGFHGWASEWNDAGDRRMSWGCIVLHLRDVEVVYAALPEGAMVVVF